MSVFSTMLGQAGSAYDTALSGYQNAASGFYGAGNAAGDVPPAGQPTSALGGATGLGVAGSAQQLGLMSSLATPAAPAAPPAATQASTPAAPAWGVGTTAAAPASGSVGQGWGGKDYLLPANFAGGDLRGLQTMGQWVQAQLRKQGVTQSPAQVSAAQAAAQAAIASHAQAPITASAYWG